MKLPNFSNLQNLEKKVTEIRGWQDVDQVMPLVEKCIKAGSAVEILTLKLSELSTGMMALLNCYTFS